RGSHGNPGLALAAGGCAAQGQSAIALGLGDRFQRADLARLVDSPPSAPANGPSPAELPLAGGISGRVSRRPYRAPGRLSKRRERMKEAIRGRHSQIFTGYKMTLGKTLPMNKRLYYEWLSPADLIVCCGSTGLVKNGTLSDKHWRQSGRMRGPNSDS